jgi:hypothetical protein
VEPDPSIPGSAVEGTQKPGQLTLTSIDVSGGNVLQPGEYVLANIVLQVMDAAPLGLTALKSTGATVIRDGTQSAHA